MSDARPRVAKITEAIESYWLGGAADEPDLAEWWATQDAHETAVELAEVIDRSLG